MNFPKINPTTTSAWKKLENHFEEIKNQKMNSWFKENPKRAENFQLQWNDFFIDFSKNRITEKTMELLFELAKETQLREAIYQQFSGKIINETENRAVLHTALRKEKKDLEVRRVLKRMESFSNAVIEGSWKGYTGEKITDIVNIGIGGSDLGPKMAMDALRFYKNHLNIHFVSNIDADQAAEVLEKLNPETTLIIVVSKSFTTLETINNAKIFKNWLLKEIPRRGMMQHFVAVSSNLEEVRKFGIGKKNTFPMWDWVGGRFSLWSAVGLSLCCGIGFDNFSKLLEGAQEVDEHFKLSLFEENIPVILALLSIWYNNFFKVETEAIIPYSQYLENLIPYLQQAVMESNGKNISRNGEEITYQTGNIIWGSPGSNAQHAFFQLLHQGTKMIPCDFIGFKKSLYDDQQSHDKLMANFFAQTEALLKGKSKAEVMAENNLKEESNLFAYKVFEGNKPSTTLLIEKLTPKTLGSLLAIYEHKIFVQGVIWNIFSYDQWGVELGKQLASDIAKDLKKKKLSKDFDSSTASLLKYYFSE